MTNEAAIKLLKEIKGDPTILQPAGRYVEPLEMAIKALEESERKIGRWIDITNDESLAIELKCSECGCELINWLKMNFCPNCGAKMRGESE